MSDFIDEELEAFPIPEEAIFLDEKLTWPLLASPAGSWRPLAILCGPWQP